LVPNSAPRNSSTDGDTGGQDIVVPLASLYVLSKRSALRNLVSRLAAVVMLAAAAMAVATIGMPAVKCLPATGRRTAGTAGRLTVQRPSL
jgi:hypothetical protein